MERKTQNSSLSPWRFRNLFQVNDSNLDSSRWHSPASASRRAGAFGPPCFWPSLVEDQTNLQTLLNCTDTPGKREMAGQIKPKVGINMHAFIAKDSQQAADLYYPSYHQTMSRIGRERGWGLPPELSLKLKDP